MNKIDNKPAKELRNPKKMKENDINLSDLHEVRACTGAAAGKFHRPVKNPLTLRVDADVLAWFKSRGKDNPVPAKAGER
jgi:uncharacterized protein (DUF4415 family)